MAYDPSSINGSYNLRSLGAKGNGENDTNAYLAWVAKGATSTGSLLFAPPGRYAIDAGATLSGNIRGLRMLGAGRDATEFVTSTGNDVITFGAGSTIDDSSFSDFSITGPGAALGTGSGSGIHLPSTMVASSSEGNEFSRLNIQGFKVSGIFDDSGLFSTILNTITVSDTGSHNFDLRGGAAVSFLNTYAKGTANGAGLAGYRVRDGSPIFTGCNGINSGDLWGLFGDAGFATDCFPSFYGCNVESFNTIGIQNYGSSVIFAGRSRIVGNKDGGPYIAMKLGVHFSRKGLIEDYSQISLKSGGTSTWANSCPIHIDSAAPGIFTSIGTDDGARVPIYSDGDVATIQYSTHTNAYVAGTLKTYDRVSGLSVLDDIYAAGLPTSAGASGTLWVDTGAANVVKRVP